jgi:hybrid cluster-associated redox disulfide protein
MDRYTKGFVVASLLYFFLAALLGIWMGAADAAGWVRFAHVHLNLLGFMTMMIYGVGYFILPRFNGRTLRWPSWVPAHFFAANLGLIGMVATAPERPSNGFVLFSALSVVSAGMFAVNLAATMLIDPKPEEEEEEPAAKVPQAAEPPRTAPRIEPDMRVGEILAQWPETVGVFVGNGFSSLGSAEHREQVKQMPITLRMACERHGVDLEYMVSTLNETVAPAQEAPVAAGRPPSGRGAPQKSAISRGEPIGPDHILGDILATYPETEKVFRKYYGDGCFSCPGQATESVKQSAMMHNVSEKQLLAELNRAAGI